MDNATAARLAVSPLSNRVYLVERGVAATDMTGDFLRCVVELLGPEEEQAETRQLLAGQHSYEIIIRRAA